MKNSPDPSTYVFHFSDLWQAADKVVPFVGGMAIIEDQDFVHLLSLFVIE